jgi:hypothetical protein
MTTYDVRLHRQVLLTFYEVKADSPEDAASIARGLATGGADRIDDCDEMSARVDVADGDYRPPITIDFEAGRMQNAAPKLLAALKYTLEFLEANDDGEEDVTSRIASAHSAIAEATTGQEGGRP